MTHHLWKMSLAEQVVYCRCTVPSDTAEHAAEQSWAERKPSPGFMIHTTAYAPACTGNSETSGQSLGVPRGTVERPPGWRGKGVTENWELGSMGPNFCET